MKNEHSTFRPIVPPMKRSVTFTPTDGLLAMGKRLADQFGLGELWEGEEGLRGVLQTKLGELGVPDKPIPLTGPRGLTVRQLAEQSGFIGAKRRQRRVR